MTEMLQKNVVKNSVATAIGNNIVQNVTIIHKKSNEFSFIDIKNKIKSIKTKYPYFPNIDDFSSGNVPISKDNGKSAFYIMEHNQELGVMGEGTCGKTTFSLVVGYEYLSKGYDVLYLDFREYNSPVILKDIINFIYDNHEKKLLFIFDNIHLFQQSIELFHKVKDIQEKGIHNSLKIIYTGNKVYPSLYEETNFFKAYIDKIKGDFIHLKCGNNIFANIYNYFSIKYKQNQELSEDEFEKWMRIFKGEIRIFSKALYDFYNKNDRLPSNSKELNSKHVENMVKEQYLRKAGGDIDKLINLCMISQLDLYASAKKLFNLDNEHQPLFTDFIKEGIIYEFYDDNSIRQMGMRNPRLAKLILNVHFAGNKNPIINKQIELNEFISFTKKFPEIASSILSRIEIYKHLDKQYILKRLYKDEGYIKSVYNSGGYLTFAELEEAKKYFVHFKDKINFRRWIGDIIFTNLDNYINLLANKGIPTINDQTKYFKSYRKLRIDILLGLYSKYYEQILENCNKVSMQILAFFFKTLEKNSIHEEKLKDFLDKLLKDLTNLESKYSLYPIFFDEEKNLGLSVPLLEVIKDKNPLFFGEVLNKLISDEHKLAERTFKTFCEGYQFMIYLLNFWDKNGTSSAKIMEKILQLHKTGFRDEFYKKGEDGQKIFTEFFNKKYKDYPGIIQQFDSVIKI